jgi:uncharacterized protein (TIGR02118 family)
MISVLSLYTKSDDTTFDMDYFASKHMPMFVGFLGDACKAWGVIAPSSEYHAVAWLMLDSQDALDAAFAANGTEIIGDVANYTNARAKLIIGDVVV